MNLEDKLVQQYHYKNREIELVISDLNELDPQLKHLYTQWLEKNVEDDSQEFEGYSIHMLKQKFHMNYIAALLTLDWIVKSPEEAKKQIMKGIK